VFEIFKKYLPVILIVINVCAHKAPPLYKDRLNPKLQRILAINNRQVQFTFSEELDITKLNANNFSIISNGDTLPIIAVYPSNSTWEIIAITQVQADVMYEAAGYIFDTGENQGIFKKNFAGTSKPDTIAPWLTFCSEGKKNKKFILNFSEAMDTTFFEFTIIPKKHFVPVWQDYRACEIIPETPSDSLGYDTTYYLYLKKDLHDISDNPFPPFITAITPDTIYEPLTLKGGVVLNDTLVKSGLVLLKREIVLGITEIEDGFFIFEVRDSLPYTVEVISGVYSGQAQMSVSKEDTIILRAEARRIDEFID